MYLYIKTNVQYLYRAAYDVPGSRRRDRFPIPAAAALASVRPPPSGRGWPWRRTTTLPLIFFSFSSQVFVSFRTVCIKSVILYKRYHVKCL